MHLMLNCISLGTTSYCSLHHIVTRSLIKDKEEWTDRVHVVPFLLLTLDLFVF